MAKVQKPMKAVTVTCLVCRDTGMVEHKERMTPFSYRIHRAPCPGCRTSPGRPDVRTTAAPGR
jgi:hypothetical protein